MVKILLEQKNIFIRDGKIISLDKINIKTFEEKILKNNFSLTFEKK